VIAKTETAPVYRTRTNSTTTYNKSKWILSSTIRQNSVEIPTRCSFVIEFIISKFIEGLKCFEWHTAHHQELQTVFAASDLHTHVVNGRCQGWALATAGVYIYQIYIYVYMSIYTRGCKYSLELLIMSGVLLETCWAFNKLWNNKFYYKAASCWYFYWVILQCTDPWISNL
jgi:hypothetical protein